MKYIDKSFNWTETGFKIQEFVPKHIWDQYGVDSIQFISKFQLEVAMLVKKLTKKVVNINTWMYSETGHNYRGYRPPQTKIGAKFSLHKTSDALDLDVKGMSTKQVHKLVFDNHAAFWAIGVRRLESAAFSTTWVHFDNKEGIGQKRISVFNP
jgi:hypothetical protein